MKIDNDIFQSYLTCKYKAYLVAVGTIPEQHPYELMLADRKAHFRKAAIESLARVESGETVPQSGHVTPSDLTAAVPLLLDAIVENEWAFVPLDALVRADKNPDSSPPHYSLVLFHPDDSVREQHKLLLAFGGHILDDIHYIAPYEGRICLWLSLQNNNREASALLRQTSANRPRPAGNCRGCLRTNVRPERPL